MFLDITVRTQPIALRAGSGSTRHPPHRNRKSMKARAATFPLNPSTSLAIVLRDRRLSTSSISSWKVSWQKLLSRKTSTTARKRSLPSSTTSNTASHIRRVRRAVGGGIEGASAPQRSQEQQALVKALSKVVRFFRIMRSFERTISTFAVLFTIKRIPAGFYRSGYLRSATSGKCRNSCSTAKRNDELSTAVAQHGRTSS